MEILQGAYLVRITVCKIIFKIIVYIFLCSSSRQHFSRPTSSMDGQIDLLSDNLSVLKKSVEMNCHLCICMH